MGKRKNSTIDIHPDQIYVTSEQYKAIKNQHPSIPFEIKDRRVAKQLLNHSFIKEEKKRVYEEYCLDDKVLSRCIEKKTGKYLLTTEGEYYLDYRKKENKHCISNEIKTWIPLVTAIISILGFSYTVIHKTEVWQSQVMEANQQLISQINHNNQTYNINNYTLTEEGKIEYPDENDITFDVKLSVRLSDNEDKSWYSAVEANVGNKVDFQIEYNNTSEYVQENVVIKDILPPNLKYVDGSAKLKNSNHPNGVSLEDSLTFNGINIGSYASGANAYVMFKAEVVNDNMTHGAYLLNNWAQCDVDYAVIEDNAVVRVVMDEE